MVDLVRFKCIQVMRRNFFPAEVDAKHYSNTEADGADVRIVANTSFRTRVCTHYGAELDENISS